MRSETVPVADERARVQRRTLILLVLAQGISAMGVAIGLTVGTLLAADLSGSPSFAGMASAAGVVGAGLIAIPVARVKGRGGRRPGLVLAYGLGMTGAALVVAGGLTRSFALALAGLVLFGGATTANLQARYTATDLAAEGRRGTALSTVVWATTVGAVAGPNLAEPTGRLAARHGIPALAGPFVLSIALFGLAAALLATLLRPDPLLLARRLHADAGGPLRRAVSVRSALAVVRSSPGALLGLGAMIAGHSVMVALMSMTPVHLQHGGATVRIVGAVISVHVAGMFAFSPLVGFLSDRFGRRPLILAGCLLELAACAIAGSAADTESVRVGVGLTVLGLGWSCALVAGSTLLTESVAEPDRPSVQGTADFLMGMAGAVGGVLAGIVVGVGNYGLLGALSAVAVLPLLIAAARTPVKSTV
jgi:MFS family permease